MSGTIVTDTHILFATESGNKPLLAISDYLQNKSRIPMHADTEAEETIPKFLANTVKRNRELFPNLSSLKEILYLTINTLLAAELIKSSVPVQMAEFGSTYGDISFNLAQTLGKFNPDNSLCLISNTVGNNSENQCLELLLQAELLPEFSLVYADYLKTNLADRCFDMVLINGDVHHEDPYQLIKEAERITKPDGLLLCYTAGDTLLESCFTLIFPEHEKYELATEHLLLTARNQNSWSNQSQADPWRELPEIYNALKEKLQTDALPETFRGNVKQLNTLIDTAILLQDIPKKLKLIELKNAVLDYMNRYDTVHKEFYKKQLEALLKS